MGFVEGVASGWDAACFFWWGGVAVGRVGIGIGIGRGTRIRIMIRISIRIRIAIGVGQVMGSGSE